MIMMINITTYNIVSSLSVAIIITVTYYNDIRLYIDQVRTLQQLEAIEPLAEDALGRRRVELWHRKDDGHVINSCKPQRVRRLDSEIPTRPEI